jgi:carboxymethylenebutenolidase
LRHVLELTNSVGFFRPLARPGEPGAAGPGGAHLPERGPARAETKATASAFVVGGNPVRVEHFLPAGAGKHPAVLLLHSCEGMPERDAATYRYVARLLARKGYVALLVHYFDSTGTKRIDPKDIDEKLFRAWMGVVQGAVQHAAGLPEVDPARVGLVGFSLGACLALAVAGQAGGPPVAAVVDLFGCLPDELAGNAARLPPTLVLHGGADTVVGVEKALALEGLLKKHGCPFEIKIYDTQEHLFGAKMVSLDALDAQDRALDFLAKHLKPGPTVAAGAR